jgi:hypothetical protein
VTGSLRCTPATDDRERIQNLEGLPDCRAGRLDERSAGRLAALRGGWQCMSPLKSAIELPIDTLRGGADAAAPHHRGLCSSFEAIHR